MKRNALGKTGLGVTQLGFGSMELRGAKSNGREITDEQAQRILNAAFSVNATAALLLTVAGMTGIGGFSAQVALIFICLGVTGLLYPNVTALALAPFEKAVGSASALLGTIQYALGASAGALVGMLHNGTAVPMTATMAACGMVGWCAVVGFARSSSIHTATI